MLDRILTAVITILFLVFLMIAFACLAACDKPAAPEAAKPTAQKPRVSIVGGLGGSQMNDVISAVANTGFVTVDFGSPNAYLADIDGYLDAYPFASYEVGIGHSAGCGALCRADVKWKKLILCDPALDSDVIVPEGVDCLVIRAGWLPFITPAHVHGKFREVRVKPDHNAFMHTPETLEIIRRELETTFPGET